MESLIKELPRLISLQNQLRALVYRNWYHCSIAYGIAVPSAPNPEHSQMLHTLAARGGTYCLSPTLCLQSVCRHQAVPQTPDRCGPSVRVLRHEIATGLGHDCRRRTTIPAVRDRGVPSMCDYSLQYVASRPAKVGDKLVSTKFSNSITGGFAAVGEPNVAVCLLPGTEVAFEKEVECEHTLGFFPNRKLGEKVARFRQVNKEQPHVHHDALEFPGGTIVLLTRLSQGQQATVLQLPTAPRTAEEAEEQKRVGVVA